MDEENITIIFFQIWKLKSWGVSNWFWKYWYTSGQTRSRWKSNLFAFSSLGIYLVNFGNFWKYIFHYLLFPPRPWLVTKNVVWCSYPICGYGSVWLAIWSQILLSVDSNSVVNVQLLVNCWLFWLAIWSGYLPTWKGRSLVLEFLKYCIFRPAVVTGPWVGFF